MTIITFIFLVQHMFTATGGWSPPTCNGPAKEYILQHSINGEAWQYVATTTDTLYTWDITFEDDHRIRVAAIDTLDRMGSFSYPSPTFATRDSLHQMPIYPGKPTMEK